MEFKDKLNYYIELLNCSSKDFAKAANISAAAISRYRNGERVPSFENKQFKSIVDGIVLLAKESNKQDITFESVSEDFNSVFGKNATDFAVIRKNFNILISELNINISKLSKNLGFDSSYISRIGSGQRKPYDVERFVHSICEYIIKFYSSDEDKKNIANILNVNPSDLDDNYFDKLENWIFTANNNTTSYITTFLEKLDEFNLEEYIEAIHFNDIKVPTMPFHFSTSKNYYGLDEMKKGELDFFKSTILSKSRRNNIYVQ